MFNSVDINSDLRIVRIGGGNRLINERYQHNLKELVEIIGEKYPGIDVWYDRKVVPGLREKERFAYIAYCKGQPMASAIIRRGKDSKLCSMRIHPQVRMKRMGHLLVSLLAREIKSFAEKVHFTAPLSVYEAYKPFFDKLGFDFLGEATRQYRLFDKEILCSADVSMLWKNVITGLDKTIEEFTQAGNRSHPDIVVSIKPKFSEKIMKKKKTVEVRRKFSRKWKGCHALLYASSPVCEFFGEAKITDIIEDHPREIWNLFGSDLGVDENEYHDYCTGTDKINALVLSEIDVYRLGISKDRIEFLLNEELKAPQSYCAIKEGTTWPTAVYLNYLLMA